MAKKYKVKRYYGKDVGFYRAKPHPLLIALIILSLVGLGFLGTVIYEPVYDFIMNVGKESNQAASAPDELESVPEYEPPDEPEPDEAASSGVHEKLRAVYAPHEIISDEKKLEEFLTGLSGAEINAVMIDVKNSDGEILFNTSNKKALEWGAAAPTAVDIKALSSSLKAKGFLLVARMSVFRDAIAAGRGMREYAIGYRGAPNALWLDNAPENGGKPWLNPYSKPAGDYIDSIALEVCEAGVTMLVLENLRFPDSSSVYAVFNAEETEPEKSRAEILKETFSRLSELTQKSGVRLAAFYTALEPTLSENERDRYGGPVLDILGGTLLLDVRPALFGGDYNKAGLEIARPLENPSGVVTASLNYVKAGIAENVEIIPYIQGGNVEGFNEPALYGAEQVNDQIKALSDLGYQEYFLYSADGVYHQLEQLEAAHTS